MIITCPACSTRYDLPEGAIGEEGRTVRCAQCRHSWFQPGPGSDAEPMLVDPSAPLPAEVEAEAQAAGAPEAAVAAPVAAAPALAAAEPEPTIAEPVAVEEAYAPPKRRGWVKYLVMLLVLFLLLLAAIGGALYYYGTPDWLPIRHTALATSRNGLALNFPPSMIERKTLDDGTEFFGARGTVTNTSASSRSVPPIEIVLRDSGKRVVYRWEVVPPKPRLAPGESMTITEAVTDIPKSATVPEIGWKAG